MDENRRRVSKVISGVPKITTMKMGYDAVSETLQDEYEYLCDYVRYREIELLKELLEGNGVEGSIGEAGVDYGDTSRILNKIFPDRKLYLYDTFSGFERDDSEFETQNYSVDSDFFESWKARRPDTDEMLSIVKGQLEHPENVIIRKGYFPDTALEHDQNEKFALVIIDMDLYQPCFSALKFFYPRLSRGGYIMLHDYNSTFFNGLHDAVKDAEETLGKLSYIPLPDQGGSIVIVKAEQL